jgi:hypothetical protein
MCTALGKLPAPQPHKLCHGQYSWHTHSWLYRCHLVVPDSMRMGAPPRTCCCNSCCCRCCCMHPSPCAAAASHTSAVISAVTATAACTHFLVLLPLHTLLLSCHIRCHSRCCCRHPLACAVRVSALLATSTSRCSWGRGNTRCSQRANSSSAGTSPALQQAGGGRRGGTRGWAGGGVGYQVRACGCVFQFVVVAGVIAGGWSSLRVAPIMSALQAAAAAALPQASPCCCPSAAPLGRGGRMYNPLPTPTPGSRGINQEQGDVCPPYRRCRQLCRPAL